MMVLAAFESAWNDVVRAGHERPSRQASITITCRNTGSIHHLERVRVKRALSWRGLSGGGWVWYLTDLNHGKTQRKVVIFAPLVSMLILMDTKSAPDAITR